ncbi:hypothetical protein ACFL37_00890 [Candidatus Margulisiibacteriota bacterium]
MRKSWLEVAPMSKPLIMVVDDEIDVANSIANTIKDTDRYEVITAYSAKEAFEHLKKNKVMMGIGGNRIRLIFLDIKMPAVPAKIAPGLWRRHRRFHADGLGGRGKMGQGHFGFRR